jgi:phage shock protein PspC (stress-responsive transcriptional regulator)
MRDPLYRSRTDRVIGGLAAGLARSLGVDVTWVRLGWVVLAFLTQGIAILIYVVLLFVIPEEPAGYVPPGGVASGGAAPGAGPAGWSATAEPGEGAIPGWTPPGSAGFADTTSATTVAGEPGTGEPVTVGEMPAVAPTPPPPPSPLERWVGGGARGDSSRTAALIVGLVLVAVGAWLLIRRYVLIDFDLGWPVVALGLGAILVLAALRTGRES